MARKKLAWAELRVGVLVIASFTILIIALLAISGGAGFFTPRYQPQDLLLKRRRRA